MQLPIRTVLTSPSTINGLACHASPNVRLERKTAVGAMSNLNPARSGLAYFGLDAVDRRRKGQGALAVAKAE
jgi:hypothetical protein